MQYQNNYRIRIYFYQHLLGPINNLFMDTDVLASEIEMNGLLACSDGSFTPSSGTGTNGYTLASGLQKILPENAGPVDGNPHMMSSY
jgi:hypothetical protein